jgi:hypothetical protein
VRPDGKGLEPLTDPPLASSDYRGAYSPDGRSVIFESDRRYGDYCCSDLFVVPTRGGDVHRVHLPFDAYEPRWGTAPSLAASATLRAEWTAGPGGSPCDLLARLSVSPMCGGASG